MSTINEQPPETEADFDSFDLLDYLEDHPLARIKQVQQVRMHLLSQGHNLDEDKIKLLKDISQTDLGMLRLDIDKDTSTSQKELAFAIANMFASTNKNLLPVEEIDPSRNIPSIAFEELGDKVVEDFSLEVDSTSPSFETVMA